MWKEASRVGNLLTCSPNIPQYFLYPLSSAHQACDLSAWMWKFWGREISCLFAVLFWFWGCHSSPSHCSFGCYGFLIGSLNFYPQKFPKWVKTVYHGLAVLRRCQANSGNLLFLVSDSRLCPVIYWSIRKFMGEIRLYSIKIPWNTLIVNCIKTHLKHKDTMW